MAKQIIGFDIGENQVKLACMSGDRVKKVGTAQMPDNLVRDGEILSADAMVDFLKQTIKELDMPKGDAAIVLPASQVFVRNITVPAMTAAQLNYNLPFEFKDYLTENKTDYIFDYSLVGQSLDDEGEISEFNLFACCILKKTIESYRTLFHRIGYKLKYAVPVEYALSSLLRRSSAEKDYCILDVGHGGSQLDIFHGMVHNQRRTFDIGMQDLDRVIEDTLFVDEHMAASYKVSNYNDVLNSSACRDVYNSLALEVMKSVNFYNYNNREAMLQELYLCGGGGAVPALGNAIAEMTGLTVLSGADLIPDSVGLESPWLYLPACGCALPEGKAAK